MRGIQTQYPRGYHSLLKEFFYNIPVENYDWYIAENEIIKNDNLWKLPKKLSGNDFRMICTEETYLVNFLNVQAYPIGAVKDNFITYVDFLKSKCTICLLVSDVTYVDIYAKDENILKIFLRNAEKCYCVNTMTLTDKNDQRTSMIAF